MKKNLYHELYKFNHRHVSLYGILVMIGLMLYTAIPSSNITKNIIEQGFGAGQWAIVVIIVISVDIIAMEFRNNTMSTLMYKSSNKISLYFAKLITLILYGIFLLFIGGITTFIIKAFAVNNKFNWEMFYHAHSLLMDLLLNLSGALIYILFIITLALLLTSLVKSDAIAIIVCLIIVFLGADISNVIMQVFPNFTSVLAWNPLNMINIITQLSNNSIINITHLTNIQLIFANIFYSLLFLGIGCLFFKKRHF